MNPERFELLLNSEPVTFTLQMQMSRQLKMSFIEELRALQEYIGNQWLVLEC